MMNFNGKSQFLIWSRLGYLSLYCYNNIFTKAPTDCITDLFKHFEEVSGATRNKRGPGTVQGLFLRVVGLS